MKKDEELNEPENQPLDNGLDDETEERIGNYKQFKKL